MIAEEERIGGVLTELRHTLTEANTLTLSVDTLAQRVGVGAPPEPGALPAEPFVIEDYRQTIVDTGVVVDKSNGLVLSVTEMLNSPGAERLVPSLIEAINEAGETSEKLINHSVIRAAFLIVFFLIGLIIARLCYRWLELRIFGNAPAA